MWRAALKVIVEMRAAQRLGRNKQDCTQAGDQWIKT